jgi:hypothetical protein
LENIPCKKLKATEMGGLKVEKSMDLSKIKNSWELNAGSIS